MPEPGTGGDRRAGRWKRPDASMSLLADLFSGEGLDPGYADAAARRDAAGAAGRGRGRTGRGVRMFAVLAVAGLVASIAVLQIHRIEPVAQRQRARLITEIRTRTDQTDALQRELAAVRTRTRRSQELALTRSAAGAAVRRELGRVSHAAAATPAQGPGLVITLDEAKDSAARQDGGGTGRLLDQDLQQLTNALWAAGAEAIGINGQRLTATTAIRSAGKAILVDFRPLSPPYAVSAVGDPQAVRKAFAGSPAAQHFRTLRASFGIRFDARTEREVRLPAAAAQRLRYARGAEK